MNYLVEAVQKNRVVKVLIRTQDYDRALETFDKVRISNYRETRFFKSDPACGKILLKFRIKDTARNPNRPVPIPRSI